MVSPTTPYIALPLGFVMRYGNKGENGDSTDFNDALNAAGAGQNPAAAASNGQIPHDVPRPGARPQVEPPEIGQLPPIPADRSNRHHSSYDNPIPLVQAELRKLGIDPAMLKMELVDEHEVTWGGALTNHHIRTTFPGGFKEDFSLEWTLRNPRVTAVEMQRLLRGGGRIA